MTATENNDRLLEEARLGEAAYEQKIRSRLRPEDNNKYIALDIDSSEYEVHEDDDTAIERLLARKPAARVWLTRAGHKAAYQMRGAASR